MTQKSAKKKSKKTAKAAANPSVLGSLRSTRPTRIGGERRAGATTKSSAATKSAKPKATKAKQSKATKPSPAATAQPKAAPQRPTPPPPTDGRPSGAEIVTTAVQAAGELAQIGLTVGSQLLRRAASRIPRP